MVVTIAMDAYRGSFSHVLQRLEGCAVAIANQPFLPTAGFWSMLR